MGEGVFILFIWNYTGRSSKPALYPAFSRAEKGFQGLGRQLIQKALSKKERKALTYEHGGALYPSQSLRRQRFWDRGAL